jgi:hypothetical protein
MRTVYLGARAVPKRAAAGVTLVGVKTVSDLFGALFP